MNIWGYERKIKGIKDELNNEKLSYNYDREKKLLRRLEMYKHLLANEREKKGKVKKTRVKRK